MTNLNLDHLLDEIKSQSQSFNESDFPSTDAFKQQFMQKANALPPSQPKRYILMKFAACAAAFCIVFGVVYFLTSDLWVSEAPLVRASRSPFLSAPQAPVPASFDLKYQNDASTDEEGYAEIPQPTVTNNAIAQGVKCSYSRVMNVAPCEKKMKRASVRAPETHDAFVPAPPPEEMVSTGEFRHMEETPFSYAIKEPLSTFSVNVSSAFYALLRTNVACDFLPAPGSIRIEELVNAFKYDYAKPTGKDPIAVTCDVARYAQDTAVYARIGVQAKDVDISYVPSGNFVFLVDVSGSMGDLNRLPLVRESLKMLVAQMRPYDRVAIVTYASGSTLLLPSTAVADSPKILEKIDGLIAQGGTSSGGIRLAYEVAKKNYILHGNNRVILATDGDFNLGETSESALAALIEKQRESGIFLSVFGFGMWNYKDNKLETLARKGNGNYAYIDNNLEAKCVLMTEFASSMWVVAKDVKLQVEFNPATVSQYRLIGFETNRLTQEDFANDKKDAGDMGAGHQVTALYELYLTEPAKSKSQQLRYSSTTVHNISDELFTVSIRYKLPEEKESKLISYAVKNKIQKFEETTDDFRFAFVVAMLGQQLNQSKFARYFSLEGLIQMAKAAKGKDTDCERAMLIKLMEKISLMPDTPWKK